MRVTCAVCNSPHEVADDQLSCSLIQLVCSKCSTNLVFLKRKSARGTATLAQTDTFALPPKYGRTGLYAAVFLFAFNLLSVCLLLVVVFWLTMQHPFWNMNPDIQGNKTVLKILLFVKGKAIRGGIDVVRTALAMMPSSASAQTFRGQMAEMIGAFDEALESYQAASRLEPVSENYLRVAMLAERIGNTHLAVESLKASLTGEKIHDSLVTIYLFQMFVESGGRDAAIDLAKRSGWIHEGADYCESPLEDVPVETQSLLAMLLHPESADCLLPLGQSLTEGGLVRLARLVLVECVRHCTDQQVQRKAEMYLRARLPAHDVSKLAESLNIVGYNLQFSYYLPDEAIRVYQKAIEADQSFSWPYNNIGNIHRNLSEFEDALVWFRKAVAVNPNHWRAQSNLGWVAFRLWHNDEALEAYQQAVVLGPEDANGHSNLGRLLLNFGEDEQGLRHVRIAIRLDPNQYDRDLLRRWEGIDPRRGATPFDLPPENYTIG